ncbi:polyubiquitin-B-like isoform X1 [Centropristis striata]|uniref:polyubiquitin-B-like isoform X1 n=1 Tax=Centropristis striata TaxID=184440 RepID=UPI0027DF7315|nr:polyubiquitin-B-like isoform X1 [Centropristis striata]
MEINIKMLDGACHTLQVNPNDTVASLKIRIQEKLGVSRDTQKLMFVNGQNTDLNDDSKPLSWYGLHSGVTVSLLVIQPVNKPVQVFLRNEKGKTSTYNVRLEETVSSFKSKVQSREGPAVSQQVLAHQGRVMDGGKLSDYNVTELSTIDLTLRLRGG